MPGDTKRRYPQVLQERAVRVVAESLGEDVSELAAMAPVAQLPQPLVETPIQRAVWVIYGIAGLMMIGGSMLIVNSPGAAWFAWIMTVLGVFNLVLAAFAFRDNRKRAARYDEEPQR